MNKAIAIALLLFLSGCSVVYGPLTKSTVNAKVTHKERVNKREESYYLVHTKGEVLKNVDSLYGLKYNSSDIYGKLEIGKTCSFKVIGWRVRFMSMYRNIIDVKCN